MGTGMNLTRAYRTIILDSDCTLRTELQIRDRTDRSVLVQLAPKITTYRMLARDGYLELRVVDCQEQKEWDDQEDDDERDVRLSYPSNGSYQT